MAPANACCLANFGAYTNLERSSYHGYIHDIRPHDPPAGPASNAPAATHRASARSSSPTRQKLATLRLAHTNTTLAGQTAELLHSLALMRRSRMAVSSPSIGVTCMLTSSLDNMLDACIYIEGHVIRNQCQG